MIPLPCTVIEGIGVTKRYGRVPVLRGIDFAVKAGRVTAILGPNGAGKSTLIRMLLGLARPDEGSVTVAGTAVGDDPGYRAAIGYMPQHPHFPENLTGREVVRLLRRPLDASVPEADAQALEEALAAGARMILLDNMDLQTLNQAARINNGRAVLEISGGVTLDSVRALAETGVDRISVGALTKNVKAIDFSMRLKEL